MVGRKAGMVVLAVLAVACTSIQPSRAALELYVNYTSGEPWPRGVSARVYADGTLALNDGASQVRQRVPADDPRLRRILTALDQSSFRNELQAAAVPTKDWSSTGAWVRIERGETIALIKPPVKAVPIAAVLADVNVLFKEKFGRKYQPIELN